MATGTQVDVVMPQMGVSVSEGTITKWLKQPGESIAQDEPLLEISTDKVDTEVPSPGAGVVQEILVQEGETVEVGTRLAVIAPEGSAPAAAEEPAAAPQPEPAPHYAPPPEPQPEPVPAPAAPAPTPVPAATGNGDAGDRAFVSPVVARIASEHGVDLGQVPGTGRRRPRDEEGHPRVRRVGPATGPGCSSSGSGNRRRRSRHPRRRSRHQAPAAPPPPPQAAPPPPPPPEPQAMPQPAAVAGETLEPMSAMRKGIAEHMRRSLDTSAHVTSAIEVDMSKVVAIREKLKNEYQQTYGVNPTYLAFVARATIDTLGEYPYVNGEIRGEQIVTRNYVNLGFAVELADGKGLIVPVLRNAESLNLLGIARGIADLAARARDKKLLPDDVQGGTFTITNPGGYGTFHGTPVISQPQAAILGTYAVVKRAWVVQDELGNDVIAIRPIMNVTLTYDHRLVDGALAGRFLRDLRVRLESWDESAYQS